MKFSLQNGEAWNNLANIYIKTGQKWVDLVCKKIKKIQWLKEKMCNIDIAVTQQMLQTVWSWLFYELF